jgi:NADH-ubiquinone oxidoreductase chain 5
MDCHEAPFFMAIPLFFLGLGSIFVGYLARELFLGLGSPFWSNSLFFLPVRELRIEAECAPVFVKLFPLLFTLFGAFSSFVYIYINSSFFYRLFFIGGRELYTFFNQRWVFDRVYNIGVAAPVLSFGYRISFALVDKGSLEFFGPHGFSLFFPQMTFVLTWLQSGRVYQYAFFFVLGLVCLVCSPLFFEQDVFLLFLAICC